MWGARMPESSFCLAEKDIDGGGHNLHGCFLEKGHDGPHACCSCHVVWEDEDA